MISILRDSLLVLLLSGLCGCSTQHVEHEWLHDDPDRNLQADAYDCETITMQRSGSEVIPNDRDIDAKHTGSGYGMDVEIQECLINKFGWTQFSWAAK